MTPSRKMTKAMDMRFYWVQYIIHQGHYNVFWEPGETNWDNYFTKHHPPHHNLIIQPLYLQFPGNENNSSSRVCYYIQNTRKKHD